MGANRRGAAKPGLVPTHLTLGKWQKAWFEMFLSKLDLLRSKGASILRVHDVKETVECVKIFKELKN